MTIFAGINNQVINEIAMKKLIFTLSIVLASMTASAQSEGYQLPDGFMSVELQANPFSNDFNMFKMAEFKVRLFLDSKNVVRLKVGAGFDNDSDDKTTNFDSRLLTKPNETSYYTSTTKSSSKTKQTALKVAIGYENHFINTGRLDFYVGAEAGFETKFYSVSINQSSRTLTYNGTEVTETSSTTKYTFNKMTPPTNLTSSVIGGNGSGGSYTVDNSSYEANLPSTSGSNRSKGNIPDVDYSSAKQNESILFANIFTGVDFFIYKGLYIGTELGISFKNGKQKNGTWSYENMDSDGIKTTFDSKTGKYLVIDTKYQGNAGETGVLEESNNSIVNYTKKNSNFKVYVEPALRIGWFF